ncbi:hypothetical protein GSI_01340 [Ganoderma sinense ZZ0214-1]|uniref:Peptidase A1 domain-containing protein n=1 Tax=Ganoderma sinense ZZ0214-1 TaxID=1077348 RepID=A0A2G8SV49_9APHY|nr:hypothetical protein GSI_01340 [Ganoderma sinense ZZ0214-1]
MSTKMLPLVRPQHYQGKRPSFQAAYARAANRYGFETGRNAGFAKRNGVVVKVKSKADKDTKHEVPATSIQNVKIGTPGVTLNLDFDTGSSDLWVWSSQIRNATKYKGHTIYNPAKSSTAKAADGSWNISYGDGSSASGNVYSETVTLGDLAIPGQAVELAKKLSSSFLQDSGNDGLLGLAWPSINTVYPRPVATPVENLINKKLIDPPVFTVKLGRGDTEAGFYSFGYIDTEVTSNALTYTSVDNSQGFWQVDSLSWSLGGATKERSGNTTILDTGTTLLLVSDDVVEEIYGAIEGATYDDEQGGYKFPTDATIPDVEFAVGDTLYKVNPKDIAFGDAGDGFVFGGIQSRGNLDFDIFGDVFLKSVYVVFNQGESTVGLAQRDD